ncbi:MAG: hypothetical protein NTX25_09630 [Proteobacteria bacterium]|nr:hypothetical protein [Pseudomonadota bacterium]
MNIRRSLFTFGLMGSLALVTTAQAGFPSKPIKPELLWQVTEGLEKPESAYFDPLSHTIFVSNIAGDPSAKDSRGWISRLSVDGKVLNAQWISGLNAPKGLRSYGDTLWVADVDHLVGISIKKAKIVYDFTIPGAKFLNDVAVDPEGSVYVSDFLDNKIYKSTREHGAYQEPEVFLASDDLQTPNGLLFVGRDLYIGRWGIGIKADFSTETPGSLALNKAGQDTVGRITSDFANIDGVEYLGHGKFLVSDYIKGLVYTFDRKGNTETILVDKPGAADIGFIPFQKILLVPNSNDSVIKAYKL